LAAQAEFALEQQDVKEHTRVAILSHPTTRFFVYTLAILRLGGVAVVLSWRQPVDVLAANCAQSTSELLLVSAALAAQASALAARACAPIQVLCIEGRLPWPTPPATINPDELPTCRALGQRYDDESTPNLSIAVILFTSGSTSTPKGVPLTHAGMLWSFEQRLKFSPAPFCAPNAGTLCFLPNFHVMGLCSNFFFK
jgi:long-subunit acyl-CoA synthetase (AMP-forming)